MKQARNRTAAPHTVEYWQLEPRDILATEWWPQRFRQAVQTEGPVAADQWERLIRSDVALVIPPHQKCRVVLDQGEITTAYPITTIVQRHAAPFEPCPRL